MGGPINLVTKELQLRKLMLNGTFEERRIHLKKILEVEQKLDLINQAITRGQEGKEAALMCTNVNLTSDSMHNALRESCW